MDEQTNPSARDCNSGLLPVRTSGREPGTAELNIENGVLGSAGDVDAHMHPVTTSDFIPEAETVGGRRFSGGFRSVVEPSGAVTAKTDHAESFVALPADLRLDLTGTISLVAQSRNAAQLDERQLVCGS